MEDRIIKTTSINERDSSPDIIDLSEERDDGQSINNVRFSVVNTTESRQSFQVTSRMSTLTKFVNQSMTKRPSMNRNGMR